MKIHVGDIWSVYDDSDLFLIDTDSTIAKDGKLIMRDGIPLEAKERFPGIDLKLGQAALKAGTRNRDGFFYGLLVSNRYPSAKLGAFQVRYLSHQNIDIEVIQKSCEMLWDWIERNPTAKINAVFPGIRSEGFKIEDVYPVLVNFEDNVNLWVTEPYPIWYHHPEVSQALSGLTPEDALAFVSDTERLYGPMPNYFVGAEMVILPGQSRL